MSQNFSKMSDIYIPELIELDSYWQKAVEDAIYDTLKGEKRLYYALRNRKKINEKLEKLGLKPLYSQMSFSGRCHFSAHTLDSDRENYNFDKCQSTSQWEWDSQEEKSEPSSVGCLHPDASENASRKAVAGPSNPSFSPPESKSRSKERKETPPEKMYRNPERPILGNGSLEKMKKSQNSFYCEPMGKEEGASARRSFAPERDKQPASVRESDKEVEWLHFRENGAFKNSDTEMSTNEEPQDTRRKTSDVDDNDGGNGKRRSQNPKYGERGRRIIISDEKVPMTLDPCEDLFWEKEVKSAIRRNAGLERKLYFALAKRDIVNKNLRKKKKRTKESDEIKIKESIAKLKGKKKQGKKVLSPYIRFYLDVYGKLYDKASVKCIAAEVASRWWRKSLRQKTKFQS